MKAIRGCKSQHVNDVAKSVLVCYFKFMKPGWKRRIEIDPAIMGGKPVIKGTRVPVEVIVGGLAGGMTVEEVCREYRIKAEDVRAALAYAAESLSEEHLIAVSHR